MTATPTESESRADACVAHYKSNIDKFERLAETLHTNLVKDSRLRPLLHSSMSRCKDPEHLRAKIIRKISDGDSQYATIDSSNLFERVGDLAGVRLLHLHTEQIASIHPLVLDILAEFKYELVEPPFANAWDREYEGLYKELNIPVSFRDSMYTSIHYVVSSESRSKTRAEIQVRTLMEEVWGEISHTINYPTMTRSVACSRQLKVLARVVSTGSRLVDSIMATHKEFNDSL